MRKVLAILPALSVLFLSSGCEKGLEPDPGFTAGGALALTVRNSVKVEYVPETYQIGFNADRHQFRIHNDTMSEYYILRCQDLPDHQGQKIRCSLKYASEGKAFYKGVLTYEVLKTDNDGKFWLWNTEKGIGAAVREIHGIMPQSISAREYGESGELSATGATKIAGATGTAEYPGDVEDPKITGPLKNSGTQEDSGTQEAQKDSGTQEGQEDRPKAVRNCLIIPVEFEDIKMQASRKNFQRLVFGEDGVKAYFDDQFLGQQEFNFQVSETLTLPHKRAYYGKNFNGKDRNAYKAVIDACRKAHERGTDFSALDGDGDGYVDNVFLIAAGEDEADGGGEDCIWSHAWFLSRNDAAIVLDGKTVDSYAITSEMKRKSSGKMGFTGIGPVCHEYSHTLGLKDMYDTDGGGSGGTSEGLWKTSALMDRGHLNNDGRTPAGYNAIDRDMLGIGKPEELKPGKYMLEPISMKGRYLRYDSGKEGEYYLIECRSNIGWDRYIDGRGLAIYHIDKSDNDAGVSSISGKTVTAAERWENNEVNSNPEHECAMMIPARPTATSPGEVFWPYGNFRSFTPESELPFRFWDGTPARLEITDILQAGDNVEFTVKQTGSIVPAKATITRKDIFQETAIIQWVSNMDDAGAAHVVLASGDLPQKEIEVNAYAAGKYAIRLDGLKPSTTYSMKISFRNGTGPHKETSTRFTTKSIYRDGYPFIYMDESQRNADGSFIAGASLPLCVFNMNNALAVEWFMDGRSIIPGDDGYYHISRSCTLTAKITDMDGSIDYIMKELTVRSR